MHFNNEEKELLRDFVDYDFDNLKTIGQFVADKIMTKHPIKFIMYHDNGTKVNLLYYKEECSKDCFKYFVSLNKLLTRIVEYQLIYLFPVNFEGNFEVIGCNMNFQKGDLITKNIIFDNGEYLRANDLAWCNNKGIVLFKCIKFDEENLPFWHLLHSYPILSEDLIMLVKKGFLTMEDRTLCWARVAAIASLFACIISPIISMFSHSKLDTAQYEHTINSINKMQTEPIDSTSSNDSSTTINVTNKLGNDE